MSETAKTAEREGEGRIPPMKRGKKKNGRRRGRGGESLSPQQRIGIKTYIFAPLA